MLNSTFANLLNKKKYKAEVLITNDNFTAEFFSDSLTEVVSWTLAGIAESYATSDNTKTMTRGIYGTISKFSAIHISGKTIKIFDYKTPSQRDYLFMTDAMVYVPDSIMRNLGTDHGLPLKILR